MNKLSILGLSVGTALLCTIPVSLQLSRHDTVSLDKANARIGQPLTPGSVAGVNRRVNRRATRRAYYGAAVGTAAAGAYYGGYGYPFSGYYGEPLYNAAAAPEPVAAAAPPPVVAPPAAVAAAEAPGPAGPDFALIQFNNARCEVWQNSADNPWGTDWTKLAVGIPNRDLAEAAYHYARAQGVCH